MHSSDYCYHIIYNKKKKHLNDTIIYNNNNTNKNRKIMFTSFLIVKMSPAKF